MWPHHKLVTVIGNVLLQAEMTGKTLEKLQNTMTGAQLRTILYVS
jgi:hypothetical protein